MAFSSYIILTMVTLVCHVPCVTPMCNCRSRAYDVKYCKSDFAINANIMSTLTTPDNSATLYKISIREVLKENWRFKRHSKASVLRVPENCNIDLPLSDAHFITGTYAYSTIDGKSTPVLQTTKCDIVSSYNSGIYKTDNAFRTMINKWNSKQPDCREISLWDHFGRDVPDETPDDVLKTKMAGLGVSDPKSVQDSHDTN